MKNETLEIKCDCGQWNLIPSEKLFLERRVHKVTIFIPAYRATGLVKCGSCGKIVAKAGELFRAHEQKQPETV